jgi:DNA-nicking Smr family endonuclease
MGAGVLRSRLFDWIADPELRPMIAGYARAHQRHGGEGAVYLFLKARRPGGVY